MSPVVNQLKQTKSLISWWSDADRSWTKLTVRSNLQQWVVTASQFIERSWNVVIYCISDDQFTPVMFRAVTVLWACVKSMHLI